MTTATQTSPDPTMGSEMPPGSELEQGGEQTPRTRNRPNRAARGIGSMTSRIPSDACLMACFGSIAGSLMLKMMGRHQDALFVGQWAPTFLILGVHNRLVKATGDDRG